MKVRPFKIEEMGNTYSTENFNETCSSHQRTKHFLNVYSRLEAKVNQDWLYLVNILLNYNKVNVYYTHTNKVIS